MFFSKETKVSFPELGLIAATRALAGAGLGLLLADRLEPSVRRAVGWTFLGVGVLSTIPLAMDALRGLQEASEPVQPERQVPVHH